MRLGNYDYHSLIRAANVKATIEELKIPPFPEDETEKLLHRYMIERLEKLANKLWEDGMNGTKGANRHKQLFDIEP